MLPNNLAIVGNAPNETGKGRGKEIDSFTSVARFNNFNLSDQYNKDYGKKTTHWVTSLFTDIQPREWSGPILVPIPILSTNIGRVYQYRRDLYEEHRDTISIIPDEIFIELRSHITNPSTGISFLFWLYREVGLKEEQIFGFNFFSKDEPHHYFQSKSRCYHSGVSELELYKEMLAGNI